MRKIIPILIPITHLAAINRNILLQSALKNTIYSAFSMDKVRPWKANALYCRATETSHAIIIANRLPKINFWMRFIKFQSQVERCGTHFVRANSRNSAQCLVFRYRSYHRTNFGTLCVLVFYFNVFSRYFSIRLSKSNFWVTIPMLQRKTTRQSAFRAKSGLDRFCGKHKNHIIGV